MPPTTPAPPPSRLVRLRRGVPVGSRDDGLLVVGVDPAQRVELPDTASVKRLLVQLRVGRPATADTPTEQGVLDVLDRAGLLLDVAAHDLLGEARATTTVRVETAGPWREQAEEVLRAAGLVVVRGDRKVRGDRGDRAERWAHLTWVLGTGVPDWSLHDALLAGDEPVLFTALLPSRVRVGPFVLPGTTACLRCLSAALDGVRPPRTDPTQPAGWPDDLSPLLVRRALGVAVADLCAWAEGRQPVTWSAVVWLADLHGSTRQALSQHPHCGCGWHDSMTG